MTDKELLELAAKAIGIRLEWDWDPSKWQPMYYEGKTYHSWNPLEDDGDALRLAVKLRLWVDVCGIGSWEDPAVVVGYSKFEHDKRVREYYHADPYAATRRAIVRAAAEIGRTMK